MTSRLFQNLERELRRLKVPHSVPVRIAVDDKGYFERRCPSQHCGFYFRVLLGDWKALFRDEAVWCPRCGHSATSDNWCTPQQDSLLANTARSHVGSRLSAAMRRDAQAFNRLFRNGGFVTMSLSHHGPSLTPFQLPAALSDSLTQEISCADCDANYSLLGTAFFCPCCGVHSAERLFHVTLDRIANRIHSLHLVRDAYTQAGDSDQGEDAIRVLIENSLEDLVAAFQSVMNSYYSRLSVVHPAAGNTFQNFDGGSRLWKNSTGRGYEDFLTHEAFRNLRIQFYRRHLLAHTQGIVDAKYLSITGDASVLLGQRIVVRPAEVLMMTSTLQNLASEIQCTLT